MAQFFEKFNVIFNFCKHNYIYSRQYSLYNLMKEKIFFYHFFLSFNNNFSVHRSKQKSERSTSTFEHTQHAGRLISLREIDNKSCEQLAGILCVIGRVRSSVQGSSREYFLRRCAHAISDRESELKMCFPLYIDSAESTLNASSRQMKLILNG